MNTDASSNFIFLIARPPLEFLLSNHIKKKADDVDGVKVLLFLHQRERIF